MRLRALAATLALPIGLVAACNDDDAGLSVRTEDTTSDTEATDSTDTTESTETTEDRTTTSEDDTSTTEGDSSTTSESDSGTATTYPAVIRDALINALEAQGMTAEQADCAVGIIEERVPYEDLISGDISAVFDDMGEFGQAMIDECGIEPGQVGDVSATTTG